MPSVITVRNAAGEQPTTAHIVVGNNISFVPKVSVVIPVYNSAPFLRKCLQSVIGQTLPEIEIICVDDGSADESPAILQEYAKKDPRITVIRQSHYSAGIARNAGLSVAKGEYVQFLDSDDFFSPDMIETMLNVAKKDKSDIVVCGYIKYDHGKAADININLPFSECVKRSPFVPRENGAILYRVSPNPWNKLIKRDLFAKYALRFEKLKTCNDLTCIYTALSLADKVSVVNQGLVRYRVNSNANISATRGKFSACLVKAYQKLWQNLAEHGLQQIYFQAVVTALKGNMRYEMSVCTPDEQQKFGRSAKDILPHELYRECFCSQISCMRRYYLFGFIPILQVSYVPIEADSWRV